MQNRGYLTLGRIVDHFAELVSGGDESNAIVDAVDAVNLMTTHAAKGLEFPIVFVANMHRGSGGGLEPIRVVDSPLHGESEEPSVAIGDHEAPIDRDLEARDVEEGKRLLYVALTRARDRLYLAATLGPEKQLAAGRGGLGRTLPPPVAALFSQAAATLDSHIVWQGPSNQHRFRILRGRFRRIVCTAGCRNVASRAATIFLCCCRRVLTASSPATEIAVRPTGQRTALTSDPRAGCRFRFPIEMTTVRLFEVSSIASSIGSRMRSTCSCPRTTQRTIDMCTTPHALPNACSLDLRYTFVS